NHRVWSAGVQRLVGAAKLVRRSLSNDSGRRIDDRVVERGMIENVEELSPECRRDSFRYLYVLRDRHIPDLEGRAAENAARVLRPGTIGRRKENGTAGLV